MHAFDADLLDGDICVRYARAGETIEALDGKTYTLSQEDTVIADSSNVLAIAGVMGGTKSAVTDATQNVMFEIATFDAAAIRKTASRL